MGEPIDSNNGATGKSPEDVPDTLVSFRLPTELLRRLDEQAKRADETRSEYLRKLIEARARTGPDARGKQTRWRVRAEESATGTAFDVVGPGGIELPDVERIEYRGGTHDADERPSVSIRFVDGEVELVRNFDLEIVDQVNLTGSRVRHVAADGQVEELVAAGAASIGTIPDRATLAQSFRLAGEAWQSETERLRRAARMVADPEAAGSLFECSESAEAVAECMSRIGCALAALAREGQP